MISDGYGPIPVRPILVMNASEAELAPVLKANFMQPVIQITNNMLVVDTGRERLLVDTGFGEKLGPSFGSFPGLEANLRRAGITPESIDLVVTSHGHLDHIGGLVTKSGALAFPKAQFVFVDTEWNYWTGSRYESEINSSPMPDPFKKGTIAAARENLPPVADRSRFVKQDGEITSGVHYIAAPGHSPSHASILFTSGNEQFVHMGDIAHNPVTSLQHPEWTPIFDYDPAQAIKSRKAILDRVATDRVMAMGCHFPFPAIGHVVRRDPAYTGKPPSGSGRGADDPLGERDAFKAGPLRWPSWTTTRTSLFRWRTVRFWMRGGPLRSLTTISRVRRRSSSACSLSTSSA